MTRPLQGKTVLITGGTAGIGKACAEAVLTAGAEAVVINGRSRDRGERAVGTLTDRFPKARIGLVLGDMAQVADAEAVARTHADWKSRGLPIAQAPTAMDFGHTFVALDPDGHRLRVFAPGATGGAQ